MSKRKWTKEEIDEFRSGGIDDLLFYYNKEDSNLFVPKAIGFGWSLNFAHPLSWVFIAFIIIFVVICFLVG